MAKYTVTITLDGTRKGSVEKALKKAFGKDLPDVAFVVEKIKSPENRAERLAVAESLADDAKGIVEELKDEMDQWRDSIPENLQQGDKYQEVEAACDALEEIQSNLEQCEFGNVEFPGMFG